MAETENKKQGANVPNLRFAEFEGDWEEKKLGEIGETIIGLTYSPTDVVNDGGTIVLRSSNIQNGNIDYSDLVKVSKEIRERQTTKIDDILICARNGSQRLIGKNAILKKGDENISFGAFMMVFRSNQNLFVHQLLRTERYSTQINENLGARINQITSADFNNFKFYFPQQSEQNKIAKLLKIFDDRVISQRKTIEDYKQLRKTIFSSYILQKLRFKNENGKSFDEWDEVELKDFLFQRNERNKNLENKLVLSVNNKRGFVTQEEQFDGYEVASKDLSNYKIVRKNNIAYNPSRINIGSIAELNNFKSGIVSPMYVVFEIKGNLNSTFFLNLFQTHEFKYKIKSSCAGSVRESLNFNDLCEFSIFLPSLEEQNKVSDFLQTLNRKVELESSLLSLFELQKKYLLKNMFI